MGGPPLDGGWVCLRDGRITALGRRRPSGPTVDLGDAVIIPGLVNAHTHLEFSDTRSPLDAAGGLPAWIERVVGLRRARGDDTRVEEGRVRAAIGAGLAESARAGVTAIGEIATTSPLDAYALPGPRVRVFREALALANPAVQVALHRITSALGSRPAGAALLGISPHAPYSVAAPLGRAVVALARRHALPVAMHIGESREEAALSAGGAGPFRDLLGRLGAWPLEQTPRLLPAADWITLLARAPRGMVVHGTFLPDDHVAMARLARHRDRLCMAVCPRTTQRLSGRLPPVAAFLAAGLRVAIGTDSRASNPDLSLLAECRVLVDAGVVQPREALCMATRDGAWALGLERRCGLLAPGRPADLVILRPSAPHADPFEAVLDPATRIVATLRRGRQLWPIPPGTAIA
jgi:cytosine/adenosine deaminase-related metal-dependent hydrolase